jgi:hypothetical protein
MSTLTPEQRRKGLEASLEARKRAPTKKEKMAAYAETFARQRSEYQKHPHKRIGLPLVDRAEKGNLAAAVKLTCLECCSWVRQEIRDCVIVACPLYPFRPFQTMTSRNPNDPPVKPPPDVPRATQADDLPEEGAEVADAPGSPFC